MAGRKSKSSKGAATLPRGRKPDSTPAGGGLASSRDSRGPDTGEPLEREVLPPGRKRRSGGQLDESFDDDLTR